MLGLKPRMAPPLEPSFQIQYAAAGRYQLGTIERRFHVPVEALLGCTEGVVALLQYGEILRTIPYVWRLLRVGPGRPLQRLMEMTLDDGRAMLIYDFDKKIDISEEVLRNSYLRILAAKTTWAKGRRGNHLSGAKVVSGKRRGQSFGGQPLKKQKSSNLLQSPTDDHPTETLFDLTKSPKDEIPGDEDITVPDPEETGGQTLSLKEAIILARNAANTMKQS
ncbi:hypothetical protein BDV32DRAFT_152935 [Aspergillus pseudonomiae]|nr:hypothetical protein BDV32DRAFT_152935 [Aspergillus pseudonomiae]